MVSTIAGNGSPGYVDGPGDVAQFYNPYYLAIDAQGNIFVSDNFNNRIRKISPQGIVTTFAGSGDIAGYADGPGNVAKFWSPYGLTIDSQGNLYVADAGNHRIRKITPQGVVSTFAGSGTRGYADGSADVAQFNLPVDVSIDLSGNLYVADADNHKIRKISSQGVVTTLAGSSEGYTDGSGSTAQFNKPQGIKVDGLGNVYVTEFFNHSVRMIRPQGVVTTIAGNGTEGFSDGIGSTARFSNPNGLTLDSYGDLYVADAGNNRIRKLTLQ